MNPNLDLYATLLDIPNLEIERVDIIKNVFHIYCKIISSTSQICPSCQEEVFKKTPKYRREIRDLDISGRKVILHLLVHQYHCECGRTFSEQFDFVSSGKSYTKRQAKWIFEMSAKQSHLQVGALVDMSHKMVERICYEQVEFRQIDWSKIRRIGIDEFAFKKGHKDFIVLLLDLDTHEIIDILEYRNKAFIKAYFEGLGKEICAKVTDFCSDMWGPFQSLAKELFPNALIHIDRFHWTVHLNKIVDDFRKELRRNNKEETAFKNLKWKLIKRAENINETEETDLKAAFEIAPELEDIYQMKNTFQSIFDMVFSYDFACTQIDLWIAHATTLNNKHLTKFVQLFERHRDNILNYFKNRISSGAVEGKNNLLRTIKRFTFNMSNFMNFKKRVFMFNQ
jgi:transposase